MDWVLWTSMIKPNELGQPVTEADLLPFVNAQAPVYSKVIEELTAGCKRIHWMWFIFSQLRGLRHGTMPDTWLTPFLGVACVTMYG